VGDADGEWVGNGVVGRCVGSGVMVGFHEGVNVGSAVVGLGEGSSVVGKEVGSNVVGKIVGSIVVGKTVGSGVIIGAAVGSLVGIEVVGAMVGLAVGFGVGWSVISTVGASIDSSVGASIGAVFDSLVGRLIVWGLLVDAPVSNSCRRRTTEGTIGLLPPWEGPRNAPAHTQTTTRKVTEAKAIF
jgi:hypothetical protein